MAVVLDFHRDVLKLLHDDHDDDDDKLDLCSSPRNGTHLHRREVDHLDHLFDLQRYDGLRSIDFASWSVHILTLEDRAYISTF